MIKITKFSKKYNTTETLLANIRKKKKNRATNYRYRYRGINSVGQPYE